MSCCCNVKNSQFALGFFGNNSWLLTNWTEFCG
jgi:hypothetical protein